MIRNQSNEVNQTNINYDITKSIITVTINNHSIIINCEAMTIKYDGSFSKTN